MRRLRRLEFLGCARVAHIVKNLPKGKLQEIYGVTEPMSAEEEKELKAANEWAWKQGDTDVLADEEPAAATAAEPVVAAAAAAGAPADD